MLKDQPAVANAARHIVLYLRSYSDVTKAQLRAWVLAQTLGVFDNNVDAVLGRALDALLVLGIVTKETDDDGFGYYNLDSKALRSFQ